MVLFKGSVQGVRTLISLFEYLYPLRFLLPKESVIIPLHLIHPALNRLSRQRSASFFGAYCFCSGRRMVLFSIIFDSAVRCACGSFFRACRRFQEIPLRGL
jgi:hypothetical protein